MHCSGIAIDLKGTADICPVLGSNSPRRTAIRAGGASIAPVPVCVRAVATTVSMSRREFERDAGALDRDSSLIVLSSREWLRDEGELVPDGDQLLRDRGEFLPCCREFLPYWRGLLLYGGELARYDRPFGLRDAPLQRESQATCSKREQLA